MAASSPHMLPAAQAHLTIMLGKLQEAPFASLLPLMAQGLLGGSTNYVAHRDMPQLAEMT